MIRTTITASVHLLATNDGGRTGPLRSGYRSLLRFEGTDVDLGFELELHPEMNANELAPGASGTARLSFWATEQLPTMLAGQRFEIREGTRVVGRGSVAEP